MDLPMDDIVALLRLHFPEAQGIYLYGSMAGNAATPASDIDLAVLSGREILPIKRFEVAQEIAAKSKREVDLVDLRHAPTVLQFQVVSTGRRLDAADASVCESFEDFVYKTYAKLNEERAGILKDIQTRGQIF